jgi:hypothetical protein
MPWRACYRAKNIITIFCHSLINFNKTILPVGKQIQSAGLWADGSRHRLIPVQQLSFFGGWHAIKKNKFDLKNAG